MTTKKLIQRVFSCPTAPFREGWVLHEIETILKEKRIPYFKDRIGTIFAGVRTAKDLRAKRPRVALFAHTDHPGGLIKTESRKRRGNETTYRALWFGGSDFTKMLSKKIIALDPTEPSERYKGTISTLKPLKNRRRGQPLEITLKGDIRLSEGSFATFDLPDYQFKGDRIHTRVADDLVGVVISLGALIDDRRTKQNRIISVFTRAEETGFVGLVDVLDRKAWPKAIPTVVLEASKTLPQAEIGKGPVIRLADRLSLYDADMANLFTETAAKIQKRKKSFRFQRRIMDGGACEATALRLWGSPTIGLAVPLGNYHNQGPRGPAPEIISFKDTEWARELCVAFAANIPKLAKAPEELQKTIRSFHKMTGKHLLEKVEYQFSK
jgi:endoglucanase